MTWIWLKSLTLQFCTPPCCCKKHYQLGDAHTIDLGLKLWSCDVISPLHCMTGMKVVTELWCHPGTFIATCIFLLFLESSILFYQLWPLAGSPTNVWPGSWKGFWLKVKLGGELWEEHLVRTIEGEMKYVDENCYDVTEFKGELKNWTKKPVFIKMLFETLKKCRSYPANNIHHKFY